MPLHATIHSSASKHAKIKIASANLDATSISNWIFCRVRQFYEASTPRAFGQGTKYPAQCPERQNLLYASAEITGRYNTATCQNQLSLLPLTP